MHRAEVSTALRCPRLPLTAALAGALVCACGSGEPAGAASTAGAGRPDHARCAELFADAVASAEPAPSFERDVMPIFGLSCNLAECHRGTLSNRQLRLGPACVYDAATKSCSFEPGALTPDVLDAVHAQLQAPSPRSPAVVQVVPGEPEQSFLLHKLGGCPDYSAEAQSPEAQSPEAQSPGDVMPPGQALARSSLERFSVIARWVAAGAAR